MRIGVFDSGIGGITVLNALRERFADFEFVYLGDTANVPYGTKSPAQIEKLSVNCALMLKERSVDAVVVACNTASSWALGAIRETMGNTPVFGVVEPGVEAVIRALAEAEAQGRKKSSRIPILILATRATVMSQAYGKALRKVLEPRLRSSKGGVSLVQEQACPLLVPMIEEGWVDHPILHQTIAEYVKPYWNGEGADASGIALLGCTHYPWIQKAFEKALPGWKVLNSAQAVADSLSRHVFTAHKFISGKKTVAASTGGKGRKREVEWIFTDPEALPSFARQLVWPQGRKVVRLQREKAPI